MAAGLTQTKAEGSHLTSLMRDVFDASCDALQSYREIGFLAGALVIRFYKTLY